MRGKHPADTPQGESGQEQAAASQADLIDGIARDAEAEAERLVEVAEKAAAERKKAAADQAQALLQQAETKAEEQAQRLRSQSASSLRMETRRRYLRLREQAVQEVLAGARKRLAEMVGRPEYRQVLLAWIVEAAIGLAASEAVVNASVSERKQIDKKLLEDAQSRFGELTGGKLNLTLADEDPLIPQGVVLRAADGRVEFNNQVATRLLRRQSEIRKVIHDILWKNESSDR